MLACATRTKDHGKDRLIVFDKDMTNPKWDREIRMSQAHYAPDGCLLVVYSLRGDEAPNGNFDDDVYEVEAQGPPKRVTELRTYVDGFVTVRGGVHEIPTPEGA